MVKYFQGLSKKHKANSFFCKLFPRYFKTPVPRKYFLCLNSEKIQIKKQGHNDMSLNS